LPTMMVSSIHGRACGAIHALTVWGGSLVIRHTDFDVVMEGGLRPVCVTI